MAETRDTSLTSRARRVAVQRPRRRPVPVKGYSVLPGDRGTYLKMKVREKAAKKIFGAKNFFWTPIQTFGDLIMLDP